MNMIKKINMDKKKILMLIIVLATNYLAYYLSKIILINCNNYIDLSLGLDDKIPFVKEFIIVYILAFVQWILGYILLAATENEIFYKVAFANVIAKIICFMFFVLMPTTIVRPDIEGKGFIDFLVNLVYKSDTPNNLFPSIHCLESYVVARTAWMSDKYHISYKIGTSIFSVLVFMSVVFVKQHFLVDIPAGILVFELAYFCVKFTPLNRIACKIGKTYKESEVK